MNKWHGVGIFLAVAVGAALAQEISTAQEKELAAINLEYIQKETELGNRIGQTISDLEQELIREGRLGNEQAAKVSAKRVNAIMLEMSDLYGKFISTNVEHMLKAKNVLTLEQKVEFISHLRPTNVMNYSEIMFLQPDLFNMPLDLDISQREKMIKLEAALLVKEVKLERDIELALLKIEAELLSEAIDSSKIDKQMMELAKLAGKAIENRIEFVLKAKDELTLEQKRILARLVGLE